MIAAPPPPRQTRSSRPRSALRPGELVVVDLRGPAAHRLSRCAGEVVAADATAIRLRLAWTMVDLRSSPAHGEAVIPWARIERVAIEAPR